MILGVLVLTALVVGLAIFAWWSFAKERQQERALEARRPEIEQRYRAAMLGLATVRSFVVLARTGDHLDARREEVFDQTVTWDGHNSIMLVENHYYSGGVETVAKLTADEASRKLMYKSLSRVLAVTESAELLREGAGR